MTNWLATRRSAIYLGQSYVILQADDSTTWDCYILSVGEIEAVISW